MNKPKKAGKTPKSPQPKTLSKSPRQQAPAPLPRTAPPDRLPIWPETQRLLRHWVGWMEARGYATPVRRTFPLALALLTVIQAAIGESSLQWYIVGAWAILALLLYPLEHYKSEIEIARLDAIIRSHSDRLARINGPFAGSIRSFAQPLSLGQQLSDAECHHLCVGLLQRIRDYTAVGLGVNDEIELRATLAVPQPVNGEPTEHLRVYCYNQPFGERNWSRLEMHWEGAPAAFLTQEVQIISDVRKLKATVGGRKRRYRSVASIPIIAPLDGTAADGRTLAVVTLDATAPGFFDLESFISQVYYVVLPAVNMVGLVLLYRKPGETYAFGK